MGKESHPVINNCLGTVLGGLVLAAILAFIPWVRNFFLSLVKIIFQFLISSSQLPNYIIVLLSIISLLSIIAIFIKIEKGFRKKDVTKVEGYTHDIILGLKWQWSRIINKFPSSDLWCFCPECNNRLVNVKNVDYQRGIVSTVFHCEHCGFISETLPGDLDNVKERISREIERKINTGEVD